MCTAGPRPLPAGAGVMASPAWARIKPVRVMMPPWSRVGIFGMEKPLPPRPGIHDGTLNDNDPTVPFHSPATVLNAPRKAPDMADPTDPKIRPTAPGRLPNQLSRPLNHPV